MDKIILNPSIPYIGPIYGKFDPGKMIKIRGTVLDFAYRFEITLQCGAAAIPGDDVAIQLVVNILDGYITLNSVLNGRWGEEQRGDPVEIKRLEKFEIIVISDFDRYKVAVNSQHYCEFPQRTHYDRVTHLGINGNVAISEISYESPSDNITLKERPTAPVELPLLNSRSEDFELVDFTNSRAPSPRIRAPYPPGIVPPPPYNMLSQFTNFRAESSPYPPGIVPSSPPHMLPPVSRGESVEFTNSRGPSPGIQAPYPPGIVPPPPVSQSESVEFTNSRAPSLGIQESYPLGMGYQSESVDFTNSRGPSPQIQAPYPSRIAPPVPVSLGESVEFTNSRVPSPGVQVPYPPGSDPFHSRLTPVRQGGVQGQPVIATLIGSFPPSPQCPASAYNSVGVPYLLSSPGAGPGMPPLNNTAGVPYSNSSPYPQQGAASMIPPPLNASSVGTQGFSSHIRRRQKKWYITCGGVVLAILVAVVVVFLKFTKWQKKQEKRHNY